MKKILITGIAGLIGNHLSRYLLDKGYYIIGIDNLSGSYIEYVDKRIQKFYAINLLNSSAVDSIFKEHKPDVVFHFAAYAALGVSPFIRNFTYSNNLLASINVINASVNHGVKKLIFSSSMDVYGNNYLPFDEDLDLHPIDPYGIAKCAVEHDIREASDRFGLGYNIIRPHNVIGVYQNIWDKYRNVIGIWIRQIINNEPMTIYGDGQAKRAFSDVKYLMHPLELLIDDFNGEIFNLGSDNPHTIIDAANIVKDVAKTFGFNPRIDFMESRNEVRFAYCSHEKAKEFLNFKDKTNLKITVLEMMQWAINEPNREVVKIPYEISDGIYSFWK